MRGVIKHPGGRLLALLCMWWLGLAPTLACAQPFPSKPVRIVVPFGAGGIADLTARTVAQKLGELLGQPVVVMNRPGAGGVAAGEAVAKADPDGHTLLLMSNGTAVSAGLFRSLPFDAVRDFAPVSTLGFFDIAVITGAGSRLRTLADLLAHARSNPGTLNVGTVNIGSTQHLAAELFKASAGIDVQVVPFNGTPAVITALRGGVVDAAVEILGPVMPQVGAGALRVLAVMGAKRPASLPQVPTLREAGLTGFDVASWNALAAPVGTPADVIERLNREVRATLDNPDVRKRLQELHVEARASTPQQLGELLAGEIQRWREVIVRAKIPTQ